MIENLTKFYSDDQFLNNTWIRAAEDYGLDKDKIPLIEYKIRDWIVVFLKEIREEWEFLLIEETFEERNFRLLNQLENLLLKK
jgi:hypothetical protein